MKTLKVVLIALLFIPVAYLNAQDWEVTRTIPPPDQASIMMQDLIVKIGQPDVEAASKLSFPNEQAWIEYIEKKNKAAAAGAKQLAAKLNVTVEESTIAGVTVRYVNPPTINPANKNRLFVHIHGGAYTVNAGYAGVTEAVIIAHYVKIPVISIDYRMPPKHPFPASVDDVLAVYKELIKIHHPNSIAIGGTSAGGGLVMASIHNFKAAGSELPGALFLGTPWTDLNKIGDSYFLNEGIDQILVCYEGILKESADLYAGEHDKKDPLISPIYGDVTGFPPTYLVSGTRDMFLSNTVRAHRKLRTAGVVADLNVYEGMSHGQYLAVFGSPENEQIFSELEEFLDEHLKPNLTPEPGISLGIATVPNLRDLGGYKTNNGATVARGLVYRSNQLANISPEDMEKIAKLGLKNDYDLRTEAERTPLPDELPPGVNNIWLDVLKDASGSAPTNLLALLQNPAEGNKELGDGKIEAVFIASYRDFVSLSSAKTAYHEFFTSLADQNKLPALFHCTTGKDRTGWGAAALLTLLDVPKETVMKDYLRSNDYILPLYKEVIDGYVAGGGEPSIPQAIFGVKAEYLEASFDEMQTKYGSIEHYFSEGLGIDANMQKKLRELYLEKE